MKTALYHREKCVKDRVVRAGDDAVKTADVKSGDKVAYCPKPTLFISNSLQNFYDKYTNSI